MWTEHFDVADAQAAKHIEPAASVEDLEQLKSLIEEAEKPLVILGGGAGMHKL